MINNGLQHIYEGLCPDEVEGWATRDPECKLCQVLIAATSIKLIERMPDEFADALFYMPGFSWERGELRYHEDIVYGRVPYVYERHGNRYPASEYTHWLPLPPDPAD